MIDEIERSMDYDDPLLAEIYDQVETGTEDVNLVRALLRGSRPLNVLECFSGTGRMLIPLACDGHTMTGIEIAQAMNARAERKLAALSREIQDRVTLVVGDVLEVDWGRGYDVVLLAGNSLFELGSAEAQEACIRRASAALVPGGHVFVDNDPASGGADPSSVGQKWIALEGTAADGSYGKLVARVVDVDVTTGVGHLVRTWYRRSRDRAETTVEYAARKRPVGVDEVETWLGKYGFEIVSGFGDYKGTPYGEDCYDRAIFWARKI